MALKPTKRAAQKPSSVAQPPTGTNVEQSYETGESAVLEPPTAVSVVESAQQNENVTRAQSAAKSKQRSLIAGLILLAVSVLFATLPFVLMVFNAHQSTSQISKHEQAVKALKYPSADEALAAAESYNRDLFQEGNVAIGEVQDPWNGGSQTLSEKDSRYQQTLNIPSDGIMATISYPRLGIDLPIRHGTSNSTLSDGAGHLYGTSMPVGGTNTHAVISAHTGYDRLMFDRLSLGEGKIGDIFYITVLGRILAYQVRDIQVIEPDDFSHFTIEAGKDQVTLLTCTPYGVNNKRMIVTGERVSMPVPAPNPKDVPKSHPERLLLAVVVIAWILFALFVFLYLRKRRRATASGPMRHHNGIIRK